MNTHPTLLDNWIGWLQVRIPVLKESQNVYWLKQALVGFASFDNIKNQSVSEPVEPIDKTLSAGEYVSITHSHLLFHPHSDQIIECVNDYANLRVEQAKEEWEKEKEAYAVDQVAKTIQTMSNKKY